METVFILLMAVGLSHGIQTSCDARQNGAQCYAAVDGTVDLRLVEEIETGRYYTWSKDGKDTVFQFRKNTFRPLDKYYHRSSFDVSSGTFKMSDITRSDEAPYVLYIADSSSGRLTRLIETKHLHLSVQAPVSRPQLSSECLSQGQMRVSCSCEGDSVQYSWTLDGQTLSGHHDTQSITLPLGSSGLLVCDVSNSVSSDSVKQNISPCGGFKFINCTLSTGTHVSGWVFDNDTSCAPTSTSMTPTSTSMTPTSTFMTPTSTSMTPTTTSMTPTTTSMTPTSTSMTPTTTSMTPTTTTSMTPTSTPVPPSSSVDYSGFFYFQLAEMCVLLVVIGGFYIYYKVKTRPPPQQQDPLYCNMVVMETQ